MSKRAALYLRVSTDEQTIMNQRKELQKAAKNHDWTIAAVYADEGISGAKGKDQRPQLNALLEAATRKEFDTVMVWSVDRLGRSLQHLVEILGELHAKGIDLYLHQQGIDTRTPGGKAMFQMMGVFAEFERPIIQERTRAGVARAKAQGKHCGRPKVSASVEESIRQKRAMGWGIHRTAAAVGCGVGVVQRIDREMKAAANATAA